MIIVLLYKKMSFKKKSKCTLNILDVKRHHVHNLLSNVSEIIISIHLSGLIYVYLYLYLYLSILIYVYVRIYRERITGKASRVNC